MDSFELNKMAGAVLLCLLVVMGVKTVGEEVFAVHAPEGEQMGYDVSGLVTEPAEGAGGDDGGQEELSLPALLANADPDKGSRVFRRCVSCHTVEEGGDNKIGPNLWNIVGNHTAHKGDFAYSEAMATADLEWTYEHLDAYLTNPADYIPGNKMAFAGLNKPEDRADVLAYLAQNSPDAPPLPTAEAEAEAGAQDEGAAEE